MNEDRILHKLHVISLQVWECEKALKILLRHSNLDFTAEDAKVQAMTEKAVESTHQVEDAIHQLPPQP